MVDALIRYIRQYRHNDGSPGFVFAYEAEGTEALVKVLTEERDRLAKANAELLAAFDDLMSWFPDKPTEPMWQMKAGEWGADAAIDEARALLDKYKATSTEREGE